MSLPNKPLAWKFNPYDPYFPISYKGVGVGFCTPDFATRIVEVLNEDERLRSALKLACLDLIEQSGGDPSQVEELMKQYLEKSDRPKHGTGAIAYLLRDRQKELDMSDKEFIPFCAAYQLSPEVLKDIYEGKDISNTQLRVLSRILGKSVKELTQLRDGRDQEAKKDDKPPRILIQERFHTADQQKNETRKRA
ncbi:MAG: hypothetical protein LDL41_08375 [Coleofasciculus sp. S288]|nr:hypothetical protein [Coleofasciculus sp. S288]